MNSIAGAIVIFAVLEAESVYNGQLGAITGVVDGKLQWLREQQLAFIGMAVKISLCIPRFQS